MKTDYDLFKHMSDTYGVTLTGSEMHEIRVAAGLAELETENKQLKKDLIYWHECYRELLGVDKKEAK